MKIITLSGETVSLCLRLAERRNNKKQRTNRRFTRRNDLLIHQIGIIGEAALGYHFRQPIDKRIELSGDAGYDFTIDGRRVEIKSRDCRRNPSPDFMIRTDYTHADYYFLAWVNPDNWHRVTLVGWADKSTVLAAEQKNFSYGPRYYIPYHELAPMWSFVRVNV